MKRMGKHKAAFYRIVATEEKRSAKGGEYIEELGYYAPSKNPALVKVDKEKVKKWLDKGAKISSTARTVLKKMGAYEPRPPKKKKKKTKGKK